MLNNWRDYLIPVTPEDKKALEERMGGYKPYKIPDDVVAVIPWDVMLKLCSGIKVQEERTREQEIINLFKAGVSKAKIAMDLSISRWTVYRTLNGMKNVAKPSKTPCSKGAKK